MENKLDQLEYTVLELGTEIFRLKSKVSQLSNNQHRFNKTINILKSLMEEKGILTEEDFEIAVSSGNDQNSMDESGDMTDFPPDTQFTKADFH